jgi:hypothetical protein
MALTATTVLDVVDQTQTISFFSSAAQVDQIIYSSNQMTFTAITTFNLVKSDFLLYYQYLNAFFKILPINFPIVNVTTLPQLASWPLSSYNLAETDVGVFKIDYTQTSGSSTALALNYVQIAGAVAFSARATPVVITLQEFYMMMNMLAQYTNQVSLN